jgi:O-antigen/teichoic acid export membrane protein
MANVRGSLALSIANSYLGLVLQLASTVVVARLLTPSEIGIFAVAAVFAALASTFRDFGVAEYLIQKREVTHSDLRASFSVNLMVSWAAGGVLFIGSSWLSQFYAEPGVGEVIQVQALSFVLIPFGAVTLAWHRREMNFKPIFAAGIASHVVSFIVVIWLAVTGYGYMSLAWSSVAGVVAAVLVAAVTRPKGFPRGPGWQGVAEVFHFGKFASGVFMTSQVGKGAPEMVIGKAAGMAEVGMFSRAAGLVEIFNRLVIQAVQPVCLPFLASGVRRDGSVVPSLMKATSLITGIGWPIVAFLGLAAFPAIRLMYGPQWTAAVPVAQVLCVVGAVELLFRFSNQALFSLGKARQANVLQIAVQGLRVAGLAAVIPFGLMGAATGLAVAALSGAVFTYFMLARHAGLRLADVLEATWPSARLAVLSTLPFLAWATWQPPAEDNFVVMGLGGGAITAAVWLLAAKWTRHPIWEEVARMALSARARLAR